MRGGRWIPGWTDTHTQALAPLDFEPGPVDRADVADFDGVESSGPPKDLVQFKCEPPYHRPDCVFSNCDDPEIRERCDPF